MTLPENLVKLRKLNNYTQVTIASKIGVTERMYRRYEHSKNSPPITVLIKLADLYDITLDYLVGRDNRHKST